MTAATYRAAARQYRDALNHFGPYFGPCNFCTHIDGRHHYANAITERLLAGDTLEDPPSSSGLIRPETVNVALHNLNTHHRRHGLTPKQAHTIDHEIWNEETK